MTSPTTTPTTTTSTDRARAWLLAGAMVLTPVLLMAGSLLEVDTGEGSGTSELAAVAADRGQFYAAGLLLALGLAMLPVCAIGLMRLTRERGGVLGTIGGSVLLVGGAAAGAGIFMYTGVLHTAADPSLDREAMGEFNDLAGDTVALGLPFMVGFVGIAIGMALLGIALWRAQTVPRWAAVLVGLAGISTWFSESQATIVLTTSSFFVLVACAVELVRPQARTIVLPEVPAQALPADDAVPSATTTGP